MAVIVNDMSEVNIDAQLVQGGTVDGAAALSRVDEKMVEMSNGCICCTLREDLLLEVGRLAREGRFEYLLIESTGIAEPLPIAETFTFADEAGDSLSDIARLDTMVTVVDAFNFHRDYASADSLHERGESAGEEDERTVVDLLTEQIEFCDVIILNKADLVAPRALDELKAILHALNPRADLVCARFGEVPLDRVLDTGRFDFDEAAQAPGWLREMRGQHVPETEEYGIRSFAYRSKRPFHPRRLWDLIHSEWKGVVRSKGYFWLASRMDFAGSWSQAGGACRHGAAGLWWAAVGPAGWPEDAASRAAIEQRCEGAYGDRRQELVFIGMDMDEAAIRASLDACLVTEAEALAGPFAWEKFDDPFPAWETESDE